MGVLRTEISTAYHRNGLVNEKDMLWNVWQWKRYALERLARREKGVLSAAHTYYCQYTWVPPPPPPGAMTCSLLSHFCVTEDWTCGRVGSVCVESERIWEVRNSHERRWDQSLTKRFISVRDEFSSRGLKTWSLLPEYFSHCLQENQVVLPEYYLSFCPKIAISIILGGPQSHGPYAYEEIERTGHIPLTKQKGPLCLSGGWKVAQHEQNSSRTCGNNYTTRRTPEPQSHWWEWANHAPWQCSLDQVVPPLERWHDLGKSLWSERS